MPPLRNKPVCQKCGRQHWNLVRCEDADARNRAEEAATARRQSRIIHRPREGYRDFGDQLGDFERAGRLNGALILRRRQRDPGQRIGSLRDV